MSSEYPVIAMTSDLDEGTGDRAVRSGIPYLLLREHYSEAVQAGGGVPVVLPVMLEEPRLRAALERVDGLLLTGGRDHDPQLYGEEPLPGMGELNPRRTAFELALTRLALERRMPIFAICGGMQLLNIAGRGTLHQDLRRHFSEKLLHEQRAPLDYPTHTVEVKPKSRLFTIVRERRIRVNSFHHQGVKRLAPPYTACAHSSDGLVEAFEDPRHPFLVAVQWHPECLWRLSPQRALFTALVEASRKDADERSKKRAAASSARQAPAPPAAKGEAPRPASAPKKA